MTGARRAYVVIVGGMALALAFSLASIVRAAPAPVAQWGGEGVGPGQFGTGRPALFTSQFDDPGGVAVDPQGNVVVADPSNHRVERFSNTGAFLGQFGAFGVAHGPTDARGLFNLPGGVAVDRSGNTYVADRRNDRVEVFNGAGAFRAGFGGYGASFGQMTFPVGVAVAADDTVVVSDQGHRRIEEFRLLPGRASAARRRRRAPRRAGPKKSPAPLVSSVVAAFGRFGYGPNQFAAPGPLVVSPAGTIYVVDVLRQRVLAFSLLGRFAGAFGGPGTGPGQFTSAQGIAIDTAGNVLVSDNFNARPPSTPGAAKGGRVQRFTAAGAFIDSFGAGSLLSPTFLAVDRGGAIYVADYRQTVKFQ
jgi:DNA-binding beta-propeller fold protein YncE